MNYSVIWVLPSGERKPCSAPPLPRAHDAVLILTHQPSCCRQMRLAASGTDEAIANWAFELQARGRHLGPGLSGTRR